MSNNWFFFVVNVLIKWKYHTVGTIPKSEIKIVERDNIITFNTQIHDRSLSHKYMTAHFLFALQQEF